jgi:hypothetical protein
MRVSRAVSIAVGHYSQCPAVPCRADMVEMIEADKFPDTAANGRNGGAA